MSGFEDDHIEHVTPEGFLLRVNLKYGNFMIFKEGRPIFSGRSGMETQIHPLVHVVFLGKKFELELQVINTVNFLPVEKGFLLTSFRYRSVSDVRHVRLPVFHEVDELPASIYYFRSHWPGPLPPARDGDRYFISDDEIEREMIVKLKGKYPRARVIVYRPERDAARRLSPLEGGIEQTGRAVDYMHRDEARTLGQNPVFAARVYLRQLEWKKMFTLPVYSQISSADIEAVLSFLEVMLKSVSRSHELVPHVKTIKRLEAYYHGIMAVFSLEMSEVKAWLEKYKEKDRDLVTELISAVEAQAAFYEHNVNRVNFFRDALRILRDQPFEGYADQL